MNFLDQLPTEPVQMKKKIETTKKPEIINISLKSMIEKKEEKQKKKSVAVYLEEDTLNKLKTLSTATNISIASMLEKLIVNSTADIEIDEELVADYNRKNKDRLDKPGRGRPRKKTND